MIEKDIHYLKRKIAAINKRLDTELPMHKELKNQISSARGCTNSLSIRVANLETRVNVGMKRGSTLTATTVGDGQWAVPEENSCERRMFFVGQSTGQVAIYANTESRDHSRKWECRVVELKDDEPDDIIEKLRNKIDWLEKRLEWQETDVASNPVTELKERLQHDDDWAWGWLCNVAVHARDLGVSHEIANRAAARFMSSVFHIDVTKFKQWKSFERLWEEIAVENGRG